MANNLGDVRVDLALASSKFEKGLNAAGHRLDEFSGQIGKVKGVVGGLAGALAIGAFSGWIKENVAATAELTNFARIANATTTEFQRMAIGSATVGIQQDKLADILKDVNDRIGDFVQTGGGPMKDFFEQIAPKVDVTIDSFRNLSGPQALGLYMESLEKANLNQQDMTFYLEAMASDATALIPLLQNGGEGMRRWADEAERLGLILDDNAVAQAKVYAEQMNTLGMILDANGRRIAAEMIPGLQEMTGLMIDLSTDTEAAQLAADAFGTVLKGVATAAIALSTTLANVGRLIGGTAAAAVSAASLEFGQASQIIDDMTADNVAATEAAEERIKKLWSGEYAESGKRALAVAQTVSSSTKTITATQAEAAKQAAEAIAKQVEALEFQAQTVGMSSDAVTILKLAMDGASASQLLAAQGALDSVAAYNAEKKAIEEVAAAAAKRKEDEAAQITSNFESVSSDLESYRTEDFDPTQEEEARHKRNLAALEAYKELNLGKLGIESEVNALIEQEHARHADALGAIDAQRWAMAKKAGMDALTNLSSLMNSQSKKAFQIGKMAAIASTAIRTSEAAMGAYSALAWIPGVGPALGAAAAGAAVAAGAVQIQQIKSQQFGGGGSVSSAGLGGGASPGTYQPPQPTIPYGPQGGSGGREVNIIFNGPVNDIDAERLAGMLADHIENTDFVMVSSTSRNGQILSNR